MAAQKEKYNAHKGRPRGRQKKGNEDNKEGGKYELRRGVKGNKKQDENKNMATKSGT